MSEMGKEVGLLVVCVSSTINHLVDVLLVGRSRSPSPVHAGGSSCVVIVELTTVFFCRECECCELFLLDKVATILLSQLVLMFLL